MKKLFIFMIPLIFLTNYIYAQVESTEYYYHHFVGKIDNKFDIIMDLKIANSEISGNYYYLKYGTLISLNGGIDEKLIFLEHHDNLGNLTESFRGTINDGVFTGIWKSSDKSFTFTLDEDYEKSAMISFIHGEQNAHLLNDENNPEVTAEVTLIDFQSVYGKEKIASNIRNLLYSDFIDAVGEQLNPEAIVIAIIEGFIDEYTDIEDGLTQQEIESDGTLNYELFLDYNVILNEENLLVVESSYYEYSGGAHDARAIRYFVFNLETGEIVNLSDILDLSQVEILSSIISDKIGNDYIEYNGDLTNIGYFEEQVIYTENFYLTREGIGFYYNSYEIAPWSMGETEVFIPFEYLVNLLRPESIISKFYN